MAGDQFTAVVSGSFRRAMTQVQDAVYALTDRGVLVRSPADPRVVDSVGDFVFVASDLVRVVKLVEDRHLAAIRAADFVWLVAPGGYVGLSGAMEVGAAAEAGTPVFASEVPLDIGVRQYTTTVEDLDAAIERVRTGRRPARPSTDVLLDPDHGIGSLHMQLELIRGELHNGSCAERSGVVERAAANVRRGLGSL